MHSDLVEAGWSEDHWNRIASAITEEALKARVAAQMLPLTGPLDPSTVSIPEFTLGTPPNPAPLRPPWARFEVNSEPNLFLTTIAINVPLRSHEIADPDLSAALTMFRRAANYIARVEDALVFYGRPGTNLAPPGIAGVPNVYTVTGTGPVDGILVPYGGSPRWLPVPVAVQPGPGLGARVTNAIIRAIDLLDADGQQGPYACALGQSLFEFVCRPTASFVLPRDRILPFLQGPLLRTSAVGAFEGIVIALSAAPAEIVVASDLSFKYLQTTPEPRWVFRVSERVALRVKEWRAIRWLLW